MPQKTIKGKIAQRSGRRTDVRATRSKAMGNRSEKKEGVPSPVANTLHELRLTTKSGLQVNAILHGKSSELPEPQKLYADLYPCYANYYRLTQGKATSFDPVKDLGMSYSEGVYRITSMFKTLLPKGTHVNIDQAHDGHCHFSAYSCPNFGNYFHIVEIKFILEELRKMGTLYENLWLDFLKSFHAYIRSPFWFEGGTAFDWAFDFGFLEDRMQDADDEDSEAMEAEIESYTKGEISGIAKSLKDRKVCKPKELLIRLSRIKSEWGLFKVMKEAAELMEMKFGMDSFEYDYFTGDDSMGLRVEYQHAIIWNNSDYITGVVHEYIECESQEGVFEAAIHLVVDKRCKIKFDEYATEAEKWLERYEDIQTRLFTISDDLRIKHERSNTKSNARLQAKAVRCGV